MLVNVRRSTPIVRSGRVMQLEGLFEVQPDVTSTVSWQASLPVEERPWKIGLIVGPSGSGKTTIARELFGQNIVAGYEWPQDRSIVDAFPAGMSVKDITHVLSSVGFSSPPSWLRPFHVLSNGEQFRVMLARALVDNQQLIAVDEFTSVIDRTVAQVGSAAVAKAVRRHPTKQLVAIACHYDIIDWLQPDWMFDPSTGQFQWRSVQRRPNVSVEVVRSDISAWQLFHKHHYMSSDLHRAAKCFVGLVDGRPAVFAGILSFPHAVRSGWRVSRVVVLPDFQGIGLGNKFVEHIGGCFRATGKPFFIATAQPALVHYFAKSTLWRMSKKPGKNTPHKGSVATAAAAGGLRKPHAGTRLTAGFEYLGPANLLAARALGVV